MESIVTTQDGDKPATHVGITICRGPGRYRMVLTRPYHEAGRIVEIPTDEIASVEPISPGALGETPKPLATSAK
ncbi:MAG TPA: hypothetical protein VFT85_01115 [Acidimicrobiia bacterium]|nr:hypothetical protein [Acidimicrobiia bacterium]